MNPVEQRPALDGELRRAGFAYHARLMGSAPVPVEHARGGAYGVLAGAVVARLDRGLEEFLTFRVRLAHPVFGGVHLLHHGLMGPPEMGVG